VAEPSGVEKNRLLYCTGIRAGGRAGGQRRYSRNAAFSRSQNFGGLHGWRPIFSGRWPAAKVAAQSRGGGAAMDRGHRPTPGLMKCSGACTAFNSGSAGERQRSGSGPGTQSRRVRPGSAERPHIRWQRGGCEPVDDPMALIAQARAARGSVAAQVRARRTAAARRGEASRRGMQPVYGCAKTLWPHLKARNRVVYGPMEIAKHYPGALQ